MSRPGPPRSSGRGTMSTISPSRSMRIAVRPGSASSAASSTPLGRPPTTAIPAFPDGVGIGDGHRDLVSAPATARSSHPGPPHFQLRARSRLAQRDDCPAHVGRVQVDLADLVDVDREHLAHPGRGDALAGGSRSSTWNMTMYAALAGVAALEQPPRGRVAGNRRDDLEERVADRPTAFSSPKWPTAGRRRLAEAELGGEPLARGAEVAGGENGLADPGHRRIIGDAIISAWPCRPPTRRRTCATPATSSSRLRSAPRAGHRGPVPTLADDPLLRRLEREDGGEGPRHGEAGRHPARQPRGRRLGRQQGRRARRPGQGRERGRVRRDRAVDAGQRPREPVGARRPDDAGDRDRRQARRDHGPEGRGPWDIHYVDRLLDQLEAKAKVERRSSSTRSSRRRRASSTSRRSRARARGCRE